MSGLINITSDDFEAAAIEYADKIRLAERNIDDHIKSQLMWYYYMCLHDQKLLRTIGGTLPPDEQMLLLDWLKQANISPFNKRLAVYFMAYFAEIGGKTGEALQLFSDLAHTPPNMQDNIAQLSQTAVSRLKKL